ncbi:MAG: cation-transporting P-type ATPase, partial [Variovorax sp.]
MDSPAPPWWAGTPADTPAVTGLTDAQAREALAKDGPNTFEQRQARSLFVQFTRRFLNPLVLILLAASAFSALSGDIANVAIIMAMVLLSVTLDFVQEHRAGRAADKLRASVTLRASVMRGGRATDIPIAEVVRGDIVLLSAGNRVPADGRVLEARDFFVNQGLLTGESYPVEKRPGEG